MSRVGLAFLLVLAMVARATAMTVFDVIRLSNNNYGDQDIIALIEATDSAFELKADDLARLIDLGVSETVIRAMLKSTPAEPPIESASDTIPGRHSTRPAQTESAYLVPGDVSRLGFKSERLNEPGSGDHQHQAISLFGIALLVLRDEGEFPSVAARSAAVMRKFREMAAIGEGRFIPVHVAGGDAVMFSAGKTAENIIIVSVSAHDASAYQQRSGRRVTADLLASYWSDLLSDYWSIVFDGTPPTRLTALHEGEALQELFDRLDMTIRNDADRLSDALESLPMQEQEHLLRLATTVPGNFNADGEHERESP